jgi:tRNA (guanine37-N1)-methyltransferase
MRIDILTLFPEMFRGPFDHSILGRARERGLLEINLINIRDFAANKHRTVDHPPFGGGAGMVMEAGPVCAALEWIARRDGRPPERVVLLCPQGRPFNQREARALATLPHLVLVCGHYEGVDERVREALVTDEISIGDYVLTGGELAAMVVVDAVARLVPGVLGEAASAEEESFSEGLLEYPHYTRPRDFRGFLVPEILLSGHHEAIRRWRRRQSLVRTLGSRPDLLARAELTAEDLELLRRVRAELEAVLARYGAGGR